MPQATMKNKTVLITGATGGIGACFARCFVKAGASVVLSGTRLPKLEALQKELESDLLAEQRLFCVPAALGEEGAAQVLIDQALQHLGHLDVLINNAGITKDGLFMRMSDEDISDVLQLNLLAAMRLARSAIKGMMKQRSGNIINVSSVVASTGNPGQCNYVASKAALEGFSRALAAEVGARGIRVNAIAPGFIETPMTQVLPDAHKEALIKTIPLGRMGQAKEIASAALFLASEAASYITGTTLHVNGGMYRT